MEVKPPAEYDILGKPVAFSEIDRELTLLWASAENKVRASLMNLVIFSDRPGSLPENQSVIQELVTDQACRAILVELNAAAADNSSFAWINAHCHLVAGSKKVCNEQIAFWLNGHMRGRIPNSVFAHLDSDLPLVFWWQGELTPVFRPRLYKRMNRFIFDSADWSDPGSSYQKIHAAYEDTYHQVIMHDLEWARSFYLRLGLSKIFDVPSALSSLEGLKKIKFRYRKGHKVAVVLLLAWIMKQLELTLKMVSDGKAFFYTQDNKEVIVELREEQDAYLISELSFEVEHGSLSLIRDGNSPVFHWNIHLRDCEMESFVPADSIKPVTLVSGQLARGGRNSIFSFLLPEFIQLWNAIEPEY